MEFAVYWKTHLAPYLRARFGRSEQGTALVEYVLILVLIALVCFAALSFLGGSVKSKYSTVGGSVAAA